MIFHDFQASLEIVLGKLHACLGYEKAFILSGESIFIIYIGARALSASIQIKCQKSYYPFCMDAQIARASARVPI